MLPVDELKTLSASSRDGVCQMIRLVLAGQQEMAALNIDALQKFVKESGVQLEQVSLEMANADPANIFPALLSGHLKAAAAINVLAFNIGKDLYRNIAAAGQEQWRVLQYGILAEVNKYAPTGTKIANAAVAANEEHDRNVRQVA